jgi:2'-5' RNA ligase superfamily protein
MRLLVIGYPTMDTQHVAWIHGIRRHYPELSWSVVAPHFTLVFPLTGVEPVVLSRHIANEAAAWPAVRFVLRSSILIKDDSSANTHILLVPDEGSSEIVKLHDRLYTGLLFPYLRLDIRFSPHITMTQLLIR